MKKRGRGRDNTMSKWKKEVEGEIIQCPNEKKRKRGVNTMSKWKKEEEGEIIQCPNEKKTKKTNNVRQNRQYRKLKIWQNKTH